MHASGNVYSLNRRAVGFNLRHNKHFKMRYFQILVLILINLSANGQILNLGDPGFKGNIEIVIERSKRYPQDWREFSFDSLSRLKEKKSYRDNNLVEDIKYTYSDLDSVLILREQNGESVSFNKSHFDSNKRLTKFECFSSNDSINPFISETNVHYLNSQVKQVNRIHFIHRDSAVNVLYVYEYNQDSSKITIKENLKNITGSETIILRFDPKGNLISKVIDYNNPLAVIAGARPWSKSRLDKYRIDYKYDKVGNWIKSYAVTRFGKHKINTREIIYK